VLALNMAHVRGKLWAPQNMVGNHPTIGQIDIILELDGDHLWIDLHNYPFQPISHTLAVSLVITIDLHMVTDLK
jgi:hypothetical protein